MPPSESHGLQCRVCSRSFKRIGHLRRHEAIHSDVRAFSCSQCHRSFSRRDALLRHVTTHDGPSLVQQGNRACIPCASAKSRCSGETPCKRCYERETACAYPSQSSHDQSLGTAMQSADVDLGPLMNGMSSTVPLPAPPTDPMPNNSMTPIGDYPYQTDWDGFFHETNWLEAPINAEMHWSPLSWDFQPYAHAMNAFEDQSLAQDSGPEQVQVAPRDVSTNRAEESPVESARSGEYYVDGEAARLPRVKRWKPVTGEAPFSSFNGTFSLQVPAPAISTAIEHSDLLSDDNYQTMLDLYTRFCCSDGVFGTRFADHELPSKATMGSLMSLYCEKFDNVLPFLHWTTFTSNNRHYLLDLAIIASGSHFIGNMAFSVSLHEFTRRCLHFTTDDFDQSLDHFSISAALLLNIVGCAYNGDDKLRGHAFQSRHRLKLHFSRLKNDIEAFGVDVTSDDFMGRWKSWARRESNIRLVEAMWLVDTMLVAHLDAPPMFGLELMTFSLSCPDNIWRCKDPEEWLNLYSMECRNATLLETLQKLYYTKTFSSSLSEFARILIIYGLFHRLWEVERYYSKPLSHWEPSSARQSGDTPFPSSPVWLPSVPAYRSWQNSSCDALDVLHWQANSTIGQMRGLEHPTVAHLHCARIVLLCPCQDIISLARHLTTTAKGRIDRNGVNKETEKVRRWALHHQYKARLAAIHAGVTFWHIRRHGVDAFYEPPALALAALVLWAFSMFAERKPRQTQIPSGVQESIGSVISSANGSTDAESSANGGKHADDSDSGEVILLDRPTDDELVQQFIRDGASMTPFMSNVGEVFSPRAPPRILDKGIELLRGQRCWGGGAVQWIELLQSLRASRRVESGSR